MAEALISRRGGAVFEGEVHATNGYALTSPFLIGAKNAVITLRQDPDHPNSLVGGYSRIITSIVIEDGVIVSANYLYCNSSRGDAAMAPLHDLVFDSATGTLSKDSGSMGEFSTTICHYKYVIY